MSQGNLKAAWQATKKARGYVATAFRIAAIYAWPFAARWQKPFSWEGTKRRGIRTVKGLGAFAGLLVLHQALQGSTTLLFPTAEEYLREEGLDPALAQQLSDKEIHVRHRNFWGRLHAMNDIPTIFGMIFMKAVQSTPEQAYAVPNQILPLHKIDSAFNVLNQCRVLLEDEKKTTARSFIALLTGIPEDEIENVPISDKESFLAVTFHEFSHCDTRNREAGKLAEADADSRGVWLAAQALHNPEIIKTFLYARAMATSAHNHDTALYLDAKIRGTELPDAYTLFTLHPTNDVFALAALYRTTHSLTQNIAKPDYIENAMVLRAILKDYGSLLSTDAKRRAELYIEAVKYFVPSSIPLIEGKQSAQKPVKEPKGPE